MQVPDLERDLLAVIDASAGANADDEHDPEGPTIGFERAQVASLLAQARTRLADLGRAEARRANGRYGECERCRQPISPARLDAHPTAAACTPCASAATSPVSRTVTRE